MLIFTFTDTTGDVLHTSRQHLSTDCGGGCCFDRAVAEFRETIMPNFVPGHDGVVIKVEGH